jgi:hypothetical protein
MTGLYSKKYLVRHKMSDTAATVGEDKKIPMKAYELSQIMGKV